MKIQLPKVYLDPLEQFDVFQVLPSIWFTPTSVTLCAILNLLALLFIRSATIYPEQPHSTASSVLAYGRLSIYAMVADIYVGNIRLQEQVYFPLSSFLIYGLKVWKFLKKFTLNTFVRIQSEPSILRGIMLLYLMGSIWPLLIVYGVFVLPDWWISLFGTVPQKVFILYPINFLLLDMALTLYYGQYPSPLQSLFPVLRIPFYLMVTKVTVCFCCSLVWSVWPVWPDSFFTIAYCQSPDLVGKAIAVGTVAGVGMLVKSTMDRQSRIETTQQDTVEAVHDIAEHLDQMDQALDNSIELGRRTESLLEAAAERDSRLEQKLDDAAARDARTEHKLDVVVERTSRMDRKLDAVIEQNEQTDVKVKRIAERLDLMEGKSDSLEIKLDSLRTTVRNKAAEVDRSLTLGLADLATTGDVARLKQEIVAEVQLNVPPQSPPSSTEQLISLNIVVNVRPGNTAAEAAETIAEQLLP